MSHNAQKGNIDIVVGVSIDNCNGINVHLYGYLPPDLMIITSQLYGSIIWHPHGQNVIGHKHFTVLDCILDISANYHQLF